jgi:hypothetical protein
MIRPTLCLRRAAIYHASTFHVEHFPSDLSMSAADIAD